jgi:hypothetical protein
MNTVSEVVKVFFEGLEKANNLLDLDMISAQYAEPFMFANPDGTLVVEKEKFLAALPKRREFFQTLGHKSTKILSLEETPLDEHYVMVRAHFLMHFELESAKPTEIKVGSIYILYIKNNLPRIVMHIEHEDLQKIMQERGLLPTKS